MTPEEFKQARKQLGLKQPELGMILGYGQQHISDMETGKKPIQQATAIAVRAMVVFGMPEKWRSNA